MVGTAHHWYPDHHDPGIECFGTCDPGTALVSAPLYCPSSEGGPKEDVEAGSVKHTTIHIVSGSIHML